MTFNDYSAYAAAMARWRAAMRHWGRHMKKPNQFEAEAQRFYEQATPPLIEVLIRALPPAGETFPTAKRAAWLSALRGAIDFYYPDTDKATHDDTAKTPGG